MRLLIGPIEVAILPEPTGEYQFRLGNTTILFSGTLKLMYNLPDDSQVSFVIAATGKDAKGNPVTLTGKPSVTVSDPAILTLTQPDPATPDNPLSGVLAATGKLGTCQVTVQDTESGSSTPLTVITDVQVIAGAAVSLDGITFGNVTKIPNSPSPA